MIGLEPCAAASDAFRCPTKWELWRQTMALLPRGRAWQSHEDIVERWATGRSSEVLLFETGASGLGAEPVIEDLTGLEQYWAAHAEVLEYLHQRACRLLDEFYCATTAEQLPEWWVDYGFPDDCLPYDELCDKVAAVGDARCSYYAEIAARRGWDLECVECVPGLQAGCAQAGRGLLCGCPEDTIVVRINLATSPAYVLPTVRPQTGAALAGCTVLCEPGTESLVCLIERIKPAHVRAFYVVV